MTMNGTAEQNAHPRKHRHKHALLYARIAGPAHDSPAAIHQQLERCRVMTRRLDAIDAEEFIDVGAADNALDRPGLGALLDYLAGTPTDYVICSSLRTIAHDHASAIETVHRLLASGAAVAFADTSTVVAVTTTRVAHMEARDD